MKRDGYVMQKIANYGNVSDALAQVVSGSARKHTRQGKDLLSNRDRTVESITADLAAGTFEIRDGIRNLDIFEGGKWRKVQVLSLLDGTGINAVMRVVDERIRRRFIRTTGASITGRGMHDQKQLIERAIRHHPEETRYCYCFDIKKCYESTDQEWVRKAVRHVFKDKMLLTLLDRFITAMPVGMSLGMRSSQGLVNLLLSVYLDHEVKDRAGFRYFFRYCDNGIFLCATKRECWRARDIVHGCLEPLGYTVHKERVFPVGDGIDALGYIIYPDKTLLRKRTLKKAARKLKRIKSRRRKREIIASFYGMVKHCAGRGLYRNITGKDMKSFSELGLAYRPKDGKKRFNAETVRLSALTNLKIVVKDFETGVTTAQGEDRCIVLIEHEEAVKKFFTRSEEMIDILEQAREAGVLPFETTIRSESFGKGKIKYSFT